MNKTPSVWTLTAGQHITGTYYGVPYSGLITAVRPHTQNLQVLEVSVTLDSPISVFGSDPRAAIIVHASDSIADLARFQAPTDTLVVTPAPSADVVVDGVGESVLRFTLVPNSGAHAWVEENVATEPWQWLGAHVLGVEHRYAGALIEGLADAGFTVRVL